MVKRILQWLVIIALLAVITGVAFSLYAHFLVDYSLENLELALAVSQKDTQDTSSLKNNLYGSVIKDLLMEEAAKEDLDFKNLILLDLASRSFSESGQEQNRDRTELYLTHVIDKKLPTRNVILRATDILYRGISTVYRSVFSLFQYFRKAFSSREEKALQVSSLLLLNQAQEKEKLWQLDEAAQYYQRYLELYPNLPDRALVTVSLSQVFTKQKKWNSAEKLLRGIQLAYMGTEESVLAANLLKKIDALRKRQPLIDKYRRLAEAETDVQKREEAQFKLALEYLYSYSLENAEKLFKALENSGNSSLRQKAKFYQGWIYKLQSQYDMSAEILGKLQQEQALDPELEIGLGAQLAHVYVQKESEKEALQQYEKISKKAPLVNLQESAVWRSVAAVEQANLYYLTEEDVESADRQVDALRNFLPVDIRDSLLENVKMASSAATRDRGFDWLTQDPDRALPLFERALRQNPKDAWAQAGIAAVYLLRDDKNRAKETAEQAYQMKSDEYTSSMLAYVYSLLGEHNEAAFYYETALKRNPQYIAGRFNLAYTYLRLERYDEARDLLAELDQNFGDIRNTMRSKILNNMGYALWWLEERTKAADQFREAVAITPDLAEAKINLDKISAGLMPERINAPQPINPKE